jgi:hypothetical protein
MREEVRGTPYKKVKVDLHKKDEGGPAEDRQSPAAAQKCDGKPGQAS